MMETLVVERLKELQHEYFHLKFLKFSQQISFRALAPVDWFWKIKLPAKKERSIMSTIIFFYSCSNTFFIDLTGKKIMSMLIKSNESLHKKMKFSIKEFFIKCDQIRSFLRMWSHLLKKKTLWKTLFFCAVIIWSTWLSRIKYSKTFS